MNFNFGEVLTRAWQIVWKYKVLWVFGILASCGQGGGGGNGGGNNSNFNTSGGNVPPQMQEFAQWVAENVTTFIILVLAFVCIVWIIAMFLSTIGKIGLIRGTSQAEAGVETLVLGQLFSESMPYFWRMFWLTLILAVPVFLFAAVLSIFVLMGVLSASAGSNAGLLGVLGAVPLAIACACLLVPVMIVVGLIFRQSERAIVLEELEVMPALSRGWEVFKANFGSILIMAIILGVIGFVLGLLFAIPIFVIVFPAVFAYGVTGAGSSTPLVLAAVCFCLYLPVLLVLQGILTAYTESAWTLTYMRLTGKSGGQPKLDDNRPAPVGSGPDNAQTLISTGPLESAPASAEPKDSDKTVIARKPDA